MELTAIFEEQFGRAPAVLARSPGRVNLLGEHVDYNDGPVLPAAIDRAVSLAAAPSSDGLVHLHALDLGKKTTFSLDSSRNKRAANGEKLAHWALYPAGVAWALGEAGLAVSGIEAVYTSDVPIGAGLSSSAAVEVAFASVWQALGGWKIESMELARLCQKAENQYLGVASGLMDQFACVHGVADHALYFDTRSFEWNPYPLPEGTRLVIADSGIRRSLSTSAYNERRSACEEAVARLKEYKPGLQSLRDISPPEFAAYSAFLPEVISRRAEHVVKEIHRVETAVVALKKKETKAFGAMMFAGHASLRDLYEVSTPELDALVEIARKLPGCYGSRLTGAGFGGCTVNLVQEEFAPAFINDLREGFRDRMKRAAQVYLCKASEGARVRFLKE
jgi:galactokinase